MWTLDELTDYDTAMKEVFRFINGGEEPREQKGPHLVDWPMDFPRIIAPVNRVLGYEPALWTTISKRTQAEYTGGQSFRPMRRSGIALCTNRRHPRQKGKGKPLDKSDREFYRKNRDIIDIKQKYSEDENDLVNLWTGAK